MPAAAVTRFSLESSLLARLSEFVGERLGLSFPEERWDDLERGATSAAYELGFADARSLILWLDSHFPDRKTTEILASHLTIGETYFFRDAKLFHVLEHRLLPSLIASRKQHCRLRIWCAGCSTGEEAYSIALLVRKLIPREWTITLLATDINARFLRKAEEGCYTDWSFRDTPAWVKKEFFTKLRDGRWRIDPSIAQMVTFQILNLQDDTYPSLFSNTNAMDLIFCRNVLMYFRQHQARHVVERLSRCLVHDGWLIVSPAEMSQALFPEFEVVSIDQALLYRKRSDGLHAATEAVERTPFDLQQGEQSEELLPPQEPEQFPIPSFFDGEKSARVEEVEGGEDVSEQAGGHDQTFIPEERGDADALALHARTCAGAGKLVEAEQACRRALVLEKMNPSLHYLHATILHELGRDDEALAALRRALYLDPEHPISHFTMGMHFARAHKPREMERHLRTALALIARLRPDEPLADAEGMTAASLGHIIRSVLEEM